MGCIICDGKAKENIVYENDKIIVLLAPNPSVSGHMQIFPKKHATIMEELNVDTLSYMAVAANKISMVLFESLKVHGTNIIIQNGTVSGQSIPHFSIHVIPRRTDDGLKMDWDMSQASNDSLDSMQRIISEGININEEKNDVSESDKNEPTFVVSDQTKEKEKHEDDSSDQNDSESNSSEKKTNYWVKSLERMP